MAITHIPTVTTHTISLHKWSVWLTRRVCCIGLFTRTHLRFELFYVLIGRTDRTPEVWYVHPRYYITRTVRFTQIAFIFSRPFPCSLVREPSCRIMIMLRLRPACTRDVVFLHDAPLYVPIQACQYQCMNKTLDLCVQSQRASALGPGGVLPLSSSSLLQCDILSRARGLMHAVDARVVHLPAQHTRAYKD